MEMIGFRSYGISRIPLLTTTDVAAQCTPKKKKKSEKDSNPPKVNHVSIPSVKSFLPPLESQGVAFLRLITNRTSASYINGVCIVHTYVCLYIQSTGLVM